MRTIRINFAGIAMVLLAAACQSASPPAAQDTPQIQPTTPELAPVQEIEASAPTAEVVTPVEVEQAAPVEVRQGLAATDPASVNLANGTPTLVEFFAFW